MKHFWQITLIGIAGLFPFFAFSAQGGDTTLLQRPPLEASLTLPYSVLDQAVERRWSGQWWMGSSVQNFSEGKDEGTSNTVKAGILFAYNLAPWARFVTEVEARFVGSRVQTRYEDDILTSGLRLREGYISFGEVETFEFRAGALSQRDLNSDLLVHGRRAFPGVREQLNMGPKTAQVSLWAQQTMPTSYSLNTQRAEREKTPSFLTETASLTLKPAETVDFYFAASHFRFNNLPAVVAFESSALGNTVDGDVAANSDFKYSFEGFALTAQGCWCSPGPLSFRVGGQWLQNTEAREQSNRGQLLYIESTLRVGKAMRITPRFSSFFNESDSSPAYYNRWEWGNNNRKGLIADLDVEFPQYGFKIGASYVQAAMINQDPFQFDKQVFMIGVETSHVSF